MPGIFTHYSFAFDAEKRIHSLGALGQEERDAFRLGNQGPDPLLFSAVAVVHPRFYFLGERMHDCEPSSLLAAFARSWKAVPKGDKRVARAYAQGFLCHYLLDSAVHPLVYAQQHSYCNAGVRGLDGKSHHEVHAAIEMELDELLIRRKLGSPGAGLDLAAECLRGSEKVLSVVSKQYVSACASAYELAVPKRHFATSVRSYRVAERFADNLKQRGIIPASAPKGPMHIVSWMRELGHSCKGVESSPFTNDDGWSWPHPYGEEAPVSASFDELYERALAKAGEWVPRFCDEIADAAAAIAITGGVNFDGKLMGPRL